MAVKELDNELQQHETNIEQLADKACAALPAQYQFICKALVSQYLPILINKLTKGMTPQAICADIKLCPASPAQAAPVNKVVPAVRNEMLCSVCEMAVKELDNELQQHETNIEQLADKACAALPSNYQFICKALVSQYLPILINKLTKGMTPQAICTDIKLCPASSAKAAPVSKTVLDVRSGPACSFCQMAVQEVDNLLEQHVTDIEKLADRVCAVFPPEYRGTCTALVNDYLPTIINKLTQGLDPHTICTDIKLC